MIGQWTAIDKYAAQLIYSALSYKNTSIRNKQDLLITQFREFTFVTERMWMINHRRWRRWRRGMRPWWSRIRYSSSRWRCWWIGKHNVFIYVWNIYDDDTLRHAVRDNLLGFFTFSGLFLRFKSASLLLWCVYKRSGSTIDIFSSLFFTLSLCLLSSLVMKKTKLKKKRWRNETPSDLIFNKLCPVRPFLYIKCEMWVSRVLNIIINRHKEKKDNLPN